MSSLRDMVLQVLRADGLEPREVKQFASHCAFAMFEPESIISVPVIKRVHRAFKNLDCSMGVTARNNQLEFIVHVNPKEN